uniref:Uncharacterized protein n=1 Tax=Rhizophora mucronata TaxID=61149 RepID=A0A2P2PX95_RHIMU
MQPIILQEATTQLGRRL